MTMDIADEALRLFSALRELSRDGEGVTRPSYSVEETAAMLLIADEADSAGLFTDVDHAGNHIVMIHGEPDQPFVLCGSHMDTVPQGGNYDGAAGVVAGLLAMKNIAARGVKPKRSIRLIMIRGEESAWFGQCYLGSLTLFGKLASEDLLRVSKQDGRRLDEHMRDCLAYSVSTIAPQAQFLDPQDIHAFLELHIEQGPVLEHENLPIGVVTGIRGNVRMNIECRGEGGHSGTTPMDMRHDPVAAVTEFIYFLRQDVLQLSQREKRDLVFTVGKIHTDATRDAVSVIPDVVRFTLEFRSATMLTEFEERYVNVFRKNIEFKYGVTLTITDRVFTAPSVMDTNIQVMLGSVCSEMDIPYKLMPSGAGHDAAVFAAEGIPTGMIFVRNQNGSHNPREAMRMDDFALGVKVLEEALWRLANE